MPPLAPTNTGNYVVPRIPSVSMLQDWACSEEDPNQLVSIVGPPGSGKSTQLSETHKTLQQDRRCISLFLDLTQVADDHQLYEWLLAQIEALIHAGRLLARAEMAAQVGDGDPPSARFVQLLDWLQRVLGARKLVLLLDGYDELSDLLRQWAEVRVLVPFLLSDERPRVNRALVARRDECPLQETALQYSEKTRALEGLNAPLQVQWRLAAVVGKTPDEARALLEWPAAPDEAIAFALRADAAAVLAAQDAVWETGLTLNPNANLLLLKRKLLHPDAPLDDADWRACLDVYLQRANVQDLDVDRLICLAASIGRDNLENFSRTDYNKPLGNPVPYPEIGQLMKAGIVAQVPKTSRYGFEPAAIQILGHLLPQN